MTPGILGIPAHLWCLIGAMFLIGLYHVLQVLERSNPWIFPDEVRYTEFARAVGKTGVPSIQGELPRAGWLQSYVLSPAWLFDDPDRKSVV